MADWSHYSVRWRAQGTTGDPSFWSLLPGIRRQLMALREQGMLAVLEMEQVTGKPQLWLQRGTAREEVL